MPERIDSFFDSRADMYERHMYDNVKDIREVYERCAQCIPCSPGLKLLDLGCGTGLELERIFERNPDIEVTGIDLSSGMLEILKSKFSGRERQMRIITGSFLSTDLGEDIYDCAISVMALHHYIYDQKKTVYENIFRALKTGGIYVEADYTVKTLEQEKECLEEYYKAEGSKDDEGEPYHIDIPFTYETQYGLLKEAGFSEISPVMLAGNASVLIAKRI